MSTKEKGTIPFLSGVILGAVVGGALGVLFAPAEGKETRRKIALKGKKALKEVKDSAAEAGKKIKPALEGIRKGVVEKVEDVKEGFEKGIKVTK
ncbi:MAG: YtxH domain-containing protein [Candidatus Dojkabacteria bacterium]|nr:YtxH domain-containing protein [Candidatus Dojkabacteria bacterium]